MAGHVESRRSRQGTRLAGSCGAPTDLGGVLCASWPLSSGSTGSWVSAPRGRRVALSPRRSPLCPGRPAFCGTYRGSHLVLAAFGARILRHPKKISPTLPLCDSRSVCRPRSGRRPRSAGCIDSAVPVGPCDGLCSLVCSPSVPPPSGNPVGRGEWRRPGNRPSFQQGGGGPSGQGGASSAAPGGRPGVLPDGLGISPRALGRLIPGPVRELG